MVRDRQEACKYHRIVIEGIRVFRCWLFPHLPSDYAVWSNQHSKFERLHGQNQETRHSLDQSGPEGTKNEAQWHKGRKKFLIAIWDSEIIKTQEKEKNKDIHLLDLFLERVERERI